MKNELFYKLALTLVPQVGAVQARILIDKYGSAETIFSTRTQLLEKTEGIGSIRAGLIKGFRAFDKVEKELKFIEKNEIRPLFLTDTDYPRRLLHCFDPPTVLYYKGNADLNNSRVIAIIGTRMHSSYGKQVTEQFVSGLAETGALIVSGLAIGIDTIAHKAAIKNGLPTTGVLAHGLDTLYPSENSEVAREMVTKGGLITEFRSSTKPDKHHFPTRNRIVAGISDATVVIETGVKGGSIITAELANGYNREVFAFPGRINDPKSAGCNHLIRNNKAVLLTHASELIASLGWNDTLAKGEALKKPVQQMLFDDLLPEEKAVMEMFQLKARMHIDELAATSGFSGGSIATILLNLQLKELLVALPGNMYKPL
ncbi:MAG: DNA-protecting protein DprA [Chitinophagaceae bacterium]|nr:DNA-protecting protein DprA [Chitinophagaceae bacterium]